MFQYALMFYEEMEKALGSDEVRNEAEKHSVVFNTLKSCSKIIINIK